MSRAFAYCRVSTSDQQTANQLLEIRNAGFAIEDHRVITDIVSGSLAAALRPGFAKLLDKLETGDVLIVTKLDRLGRNAMDVRSVVDGLAARGIRVHCLALGAIDLTSAAGKMTMGVIAAIAEFERDLIVERTQAGLTRAKAQGKKLGRRSSLSDSAKADVIKALDEGLSFGVLAKRHGVSRSAIQRVADKRVAQTAITLATDSAGAAA